MAGNVERKAEDVFCMDFPDSINSLAIFRVLFYLKGHTSAGTGVNVSAGWQAESARQAKAKNNTSRRMKFSWQKR